MNAPGSARARLAEESAPFSANDGAARHRPYRLLALLAALLLPAAAAPPAVPPEAVRVDVRAADRFAEQETRALGRDARYAVLHAAAALDLPPPPRVDVVVASRAPRSPAEAEALGVPGAPYWAAGIAQPGRGRIVLFLDRLGAVRHEDLGGALVHEAVHLVFGAHVPPGAGVPRWYEEGLALHVERDASLRDAWEMARMTFARDPRPLDDLARSWPRPAAEARAAYAQAASFVAYAEGAAPEGAPRRLVEALAGGAGFDGAFEIAYLADRRRLEEGWRQTLREQFVGSALLLLGTLGQAALGVLAVWAMLRARRRRLARAAEPLPDDDPGHDEWRRAAPEDP